MSAAFSATAYTRLMASFSNALACQDWFAIRMLREDNGFQGVPLTVASDVQWKNTRVNDPQVLRSIDA